MTSFYLANLDRVKSADQTKLHVLQGSPLILDGPISAVSKPIFEGVLYLFNMFRDKINNTPLQDQVSAKIRFQMFWGRVDMILASKLRLSS